MNGSQPLTMSKPPLPDFSHIKWEKKMAELNMKEQGDCTLGQLVNPIINIHGDTESRSSVFIFSKLSVICLQLFMDATMNVW